MYKAILFDVDGVLIKSKRFGDYFQEQTGVRAEEMLPFYKGIFRDCQAGKADMRTELPPWLEKWGYTKGPDSFMREWFEYENKPDQQLLQLVKNLRKQGVKCYLATNQEKYRAEFIWNEMGFKNYFDGQYCSAFMYAKKPNKEFFEKIILDLKEKHSINPNEMLFLDDEVDAVKTATSLGISSYVYSGVNILKKRIHKPIGHHLVGIAIGFLFILLGLSSLPLFTKPLSEGGTTQINFWQKYFMKID